MQASENIVENRCLRQPQGESVMTSKRKIGLIAIRVVISLMSYPTQGHAIVVSESDRAACTPDVLRLCSSDIPKVDRIIACMKANRTNLSPACRAVYDAKVLELMAENSRTAR
jgi:hypothetical protein